MCTGNCGYKGSKSANSMVRTQSQPLKKVSIDAVVGKSKNPDVKVGVIYYGGGMVHKSWEANCSSCSGGRGKMSLLTSETIMFASDDAPGGMFKMLFQAGRTYYVTEKQAEYLLTLTYTGASGETVNKFKLLER